MANPPIFRDVARPATIERVQVLFAALGAYGHVYAVMAAAHVLLELLALAS